MSRDGVLLHPDVHAGMSVHVCIYLYNIHIFVCIYIYMEIEIYGDRYI